MFAVLRFIMKSAHSLPICAAVVAEKEKMKSNKNNKYKSMKIRKSVN